MEFFSGFSLTNAFVQYKFFFKIFMSYSVLIRVHEMHPLTHSLQATNDKNYKKVQ